MARIRTIKPEFFKHEDLFDAEQETGLPLRLAFAGIWTVCDREGRFEWRPRAIKTDVLPYDDVDFSRVLDALATRGFVVRYRVGGKNYGYVPGFSRHQVINNRESDSKLPEPPQVADIDDYSTPAPRVNDASPTRHDLAQVEGEGEREGNIDDDDSARADDGLMARACAAAGTEFGSLTGSGGRFGMAPKEVDALRRWQQDLGLTPAQIIASITDQASRLRSPPRSLTYFTPGLQQLAAELTAPPLQPAPHEVNHDRQPARDRRSAAADEALARRIAAAARID